MASGTILNQALGFPGKYQRPSCHHHTVPLSTSLARRIRRPSALAALRTLVFRHVPFLKPQWPSLHWRPKARALRTTSPLLGREKGGLRQRQDAGGPVAQQPDLVPAGAALSARAVFLLDGHGRANPSASRFSGCREDRAAAVLIGLRSPTRRRSRASPSSPSWSAVRCRWLPVVCASRRSGACFLFLVAAARSWVLLSRRWAVMGKRVKLLCW